MFTSIETIALIFIVLVLIKMFVLLVRPKAWVHFASEIYSVPKVTQAVLLVLATIVLYFLVDGGMTVVQILASSAFVGLLLAMGLVHEFPYLIKKYDGLIRRGKLWKDYWLYGLLWIVLIVLGLIQLFI